MIDLAFDLDLPLAFILYLAGAVSGVFVTYAIMSDRPRINPDDFDGLVQ